MASSAKRCWFSDFLLALSRTKTQFFIIFLCFFIFTSLTVLYQLDANEVSHKLISNFTINKLNFGIVIFQLENVDNISREEFKIILYWNTFFGIKDFTFGFGQEPFVDAQCPRSACYVTDDRSKFNLSDVVIFSVQKLNLSDLPVYRFPHQRFVFYEMESPANTDPRPLLDHRTRFKFFNWTMTYRLDSDVVHRDSYGVIIPRRRTLPSRYPIPRQGYPSPKTRAGLVEISSKKKLAAWFVSNCQTASRREDYIVQLSRYVPVDVYGKCGNLTCTNQGHCWEMVRSDYKFYIGFENSLCTDYVTEKLTAGLLHDSVPVVMGGVDYTAFAPPHSFIDVNDFESPKELANYLLLLNASDFLYARYFDWKKDFQVQLNPKQGWCHLCQLAHDKQLPTKMYNDILKWWVNDPDNCNLPTLSSSRPIL